MREMNSTSRSTRRVFLLGVLALGAALVNLPIREARLGSAKTARASSSVA